MKKKSEQEVLILQDTEGPIIKGYISIGNFLTIELPLNYVLCMVFTGYFSCEMSSLVFHNEDCQDFSFCVLSTCLPGHIIHINFLFHDDRTTVCLASITLQTET